MTARMEAYRLFQTRIVEPWFLPRWMSKARLAEEKEQGIFKQALSGRKAGVAPRLVSRGERGRAGVADAGDSGLGRARV